MRISIGRTVERGAAALAIVLLAMLPHYARSADASESPAAVCSALATADFSRVEDASAEITRATIVASKGDLPAYCQLKGYVTPGVGFEIGLPTSNWNGKFMEVGCAGMCGQLSSQYAACNRPLRRGYACVVSDMGHKGTGGDALWAYNNLQAKMDFGYRAAHVTAVIGKVITGRFYRRTPARAYFMGCSTGGREGLVEAQRFPWDFDGIIAGDPPIDYTTNNLNVLWDIAAMQGPGRSPLLTSQAVALLRTAALAKCDLDDGVKDGLIGNPSACKVDPAELLCKPGEKTACLNRSQVAAAKKIYSGITISNGQKVYFGAMPGSEANWAQDFSYPWLKDSRIEQFRYMTFMPDPGPSWNGTDIDFNRDYERIGMMEPLYSASNPDLRGFKAAGGKLIVYQGWADELAVPGRVTDYYETAERVIGGARRTQEFFRLFMIPGMNHCGGGNGADAADYLGQLEAWVERGRVPAMILTAHLRGSPPFSMAAYPYRQFPSDSSSIQFTRPVYPYPLYAKYKGSGDPNRAVNFEPIRP